MCHFQMDSFQPGHNFYFSLVSHCRSCLFLAASCEQRTHFRERLKPPRDRTGKFTLHQVQLEDPVRPSQSPTQSCAVEETQRLLTTEGTVVLLLIIGHPF